MTPALAIVVVSFNTRDKTLKAVRSAAAEDVPGGSEIVVIDNGSRDGSLATLQGIDLPVPLTVIDAGENLGFATGVNRAVRATDAPWILLLNPDTVVLPGALVALLAFAERHPAHRVYGGRTLRPDGSLDPSSCWGAPSLWSLTTFATGLSTAFKHSRVFDPESLGRWQRDSVREVPVVTGCLLLVDRALWHRLNGMDERYFLYGEDADFCARAIEAGARPVVVPEACIVHEVGASTAASAASNGRKMSMVSAGKATFIRTRWRPPVSGLGLGLLQLGAAVRSGGERLRGRRDGTWTTVWRDRARWRRGYPAARDALFRLSEAPADGVR